MPYHSPTIENSWEVLEDIYDDDDESIIYNATIEDGRGLDLIKNFTSSTQLIVNHRSGTISL